MEQTKGAQNTTPNLTQTKAHPNKPTKHHVESKGTQQKLTKQPEIKQQKLTKQSKWVTKGSLKIS